MSVPALRCPVCGRPVRFEDVPKGPFCSERCRLIDLGAWASESYRVADQPDWMDDDEFSESGPLSPAKDER